MFVCVKPLLSPTCELQSRDFSARFPRLFFVSIFLSMFLFFFGRRVFPRQKLYDAAAASHPADGVH